MAPENAPPLGPRQIHLWRIGLDCDAAQRSQLERHLTPEEITRARRFVFPIHREHFIAARGTLRAVLASYLRMPPDEIRFQYGPYGKPTLVEGCGTDLQFNLSHSHGQALVAVTRRQTLGVDIEFVDPRVRTETLARRFFAPREAERLGGLPAAEQISAFFRCWTRKEAYLKATGTGLATPLDQFEVSLAPGEAAAIVRVQGSAEEAARWTLFDVSSDPRFAASIAIRATGLELACWDWPDRY